MALREPSRLGKFIGPRWLYRSSQLKCEKASFHEVIWERSHPRRGGLGVDACVALVEPSIIGGTFVQNQLTYPLHIHLNQELLPTLQLLQESGIILPDYNGVRVIGAKCFFKNGQRARKVGERVLIAQELDPPLPNRTC